MNVGEFYRAMAAMTKTADSIMRSKMPDYADDPCFYRNFDEYATASGCSVGVVWTVLFSKHMSAIKKFIAGGVLTSEPIELRIADAINYLHLLNGLVQAGRIGGERASAPSREEIRI